MGVNPGGIQGVNQLAQPQVHPSGPAFNNDATAVNPIGGKMRYNNQIWRYVQHNAGSGTVTPSAGAPAYAKTLTPAGTSTAVPSFTVTADQTDSVAGLMAVGVYGQFTTAPTTLYYTWIQIGGVANALAPGAVAGDKLIGSATDNQFDKIAGSGTQTYPLMGVVCGTSASGLSPTLLTNMDW